MRKLGTSAAIATPAVMVINIVSDLGYYPQSLDNAEDAAIVGAGLTWLFNVVRKLYQRFDGYEAQ